MPWIHCWFIPGWTLDGCPPVTSQEAHSGEKSNKFNQCDFVSPLADNLRRHSKTFQEGQIRLAGYTAISFWGIYFANYFREPLPTKPWQPSWSWVDGNAHLLPEVDGHLLDGDQTIADSHVLLSRIIANQTIETIREWTVTSPARCPSLAILGLEFWALLLGGGEGQLRQDARTSTSSETR